VRDPAGHRTRKRESEEGVRLGYYGRLAAIEFGMRKPEPLITLPEGLAFVGGVALAAFGWWSKSLFVEGVGATVAGGSLLIAIQRKAEEAANHG
jgi:hypothetical protein